MRRSVWMAVMAAVALAGAGCGGSSAASGRVHLLMTDAPLDGAVAVIVHVTGVELVGVQLNVAEPGVSTTADGHVLIALDRQFNLLDLQNGRSDLLGSADVSGHINQIRLLMDGTVDVVFADGSTRQATVPSGAQSGVKIITPGLDPSTDSEIVLDLDAGASIHETGNGKLIMRPTIKARIMGQEVAQSEEVPLDPQ